MELEKVVYRIKFQLETMIRKKRVKEYFDWPDAKPVWKNITSYVTFVHRRGYRSRMRPKDYHHHNLTPPRSRIRFSRKEADREGFYRRYLSVRVDSARKTTVI